METHSGKVIETLKQAIFFEKQGKAFYSQVSRQAEHEGVREIFETMAEEEEKHVAFLSTHFNQVVKNGGFASGITYENPADISSRVLTEDLKREINAAGYEAAAISAAIDMEKKAIALYSSRAKEADNPDEKGFYEMLAKWETGHLDLLVDLNDAVVEAVWNENSFWPY